MGERTGSLRDIYPKAFWEVKRLTDGNLLATLVSLPEKEELAQGIGKDLALAIQDAKDRKAAEEKGTEYIPAACIYNPRRDY